MSEKYLKLYSGEVEKINKLLYNLLLNKKPHSLYDPCSYVMNSGGKRLRPFLVLASAKAAGGQFEQVYNAAIAVEVLHNFTLVHDDIMDNSEKRRGRDTLHKVFDTNTAILAGDNLSALAYESLLKDCDKNSKEIIYTFAHGIIEVCEGQSMDKEFEIRNDVSLKEYKLMIYKKTAALAEMCCSLGAQLVHSSPKVVKALADFGKYLGMAFQIQDDLLDLIAEENEFGKKVGSDLVEGKKTYLFLRALHKADSNQKRLLKKIIINRGIDWDEVGEYKNLYIKLGILSDARKEIKTYTKLALKSISKLKNKEGEELLVWLANSLINRNK
jgi:geranylgeranyl diphosphate synthase, type II